MGMLDIVGFGLLGASAVAAIVSLLVLRSGHGTRWIWFGVSLAVFFLVTLAMVDRVLPALGDLGPARRMAIDNALAALAVLSAAFAADAAIRHFLWYGRLGDGGRSRVPNILIGLASAAGYALVGLLIVSLIFNLDVTAVAATSGVVAIVLGVSAQQTLGQAFAGLALSLSQPFRIGDSLQVDGIWGVVVDADWRAVTLRTYEGNLVTLPNTLVASVKLTNLNGPTHDLRHHIPFVVDIDVPPGRVRSIALSAMAGLPNVLRSPAPMLLFKNFEERGALYEAIFWHHDPNVYILRRDETGQALWYAFHRAGIAISVHRLLLSGPPEAARSFSAACEATERGALVDFLRRSPLCAGVSEDELGKLAGRARRRLYAAGERIFREGDTGASMFLILEGSVAVASAAPDGTETQLYVETVGEIFGHMSAMTGAPRFATVRALEHVVLAEFDKATLAPFIAAHPELVEAAAREILRIEALIEDLRKSDSPDMTSADQSHLLARLTERIRAFFGEKRAEA